MKKAGIIGGLEFIGSYITLKFLSENFHVKIPVSNYKNEKKVLLIPGLFANKFLEEFRGDLNDLTEIRKFVHDCDVIIHCGSPFRLNVRNKNSNLFVPEIKGAGPLLKVLSEYPNIQKLFFISPPAELSSRIFPSPETKKAMLNTSGSAANVKFRKAIYHANKVQENVFRNFIDHRVEVIFVSPAEVTENTLLSNSNSTSSGLKFIFKHGVNHDVTFKRILQQNKVQTLLNAEDVAEDIFNKVRPVEKPKNIMATAVL